MDAARSLQYEIKVSADTGDAQSQLQNLVTSAGDLQSRGVRIKADGSSAESTLRSLTTNCGNLGRSADSVGSAFRKSFLSSVDSGNSFSSSIKSGVGGAFDNVKSKAEGLKSNITSTMQGIGTGVTNTMSSIGNAVTHPIDTIKDGFGKAADSVKGKFTDAMRAAENETRQMGGSADDAADDIRSMGNAAGSARGNVSGLGNDAESSSGKFGKLGSAAAAIGKTAAIGIAAGTVAMGTFAASSVKTGMTFDASMAQVAATMGKTVDEIGDLRDFAQEMGSKTAFSASQAADALNYMALAGYSSEQSMAALPNVLNLAAAGGIELAEASDMITDAQSALGLTFDESAQLVDKMAKASSKSNTSVAQLGSAILTVGGTAKTLAGGTTELSAALGILADNGVKGAEGGTALRNVMLGLSDQKFEKTFGKLGVSAYDAEGNMRELKDVFADMNTAMEGWSPEERTKALSSAFNKVDLKSLNAMLATSTDRWDELSGAISDSEGAAQQMADTQLDNLAGDVTLFKSALEGAQIAISDQLTPNLREFVQFGSSGLSRLTEAFKTGGLSGAMGELGSILSDGLGMIIGMIPGLMDAGMQLIGALGQGILDNLPMLLDAAIQVVGMLASGISSALPSLLPAAVQTVMTLVTNLVQNVPMLIQAGLNLISGLAQGIVNAIPVLVSNIPILLQGIIDAVTTGLPMIVQQGWTIVQGILDGLLQALPGFVATLPVIIDQFVNFMATGIPNMINQMVGFLTQNLPVIMQTGIQLIMGLAQGILQAIPGLISQIPVIITNFVNTILQNLPLIIQMGVQMLVSLVGGLIQAVPMLLSSVGQIFGSLGEAIMSIDWLELGSSIISAIWDGIKSIGSGLFNGIKDLIFGGGDAESEMSAAGAESAQAFTTSLSNGMSGASVDTSSFGLDTSAFTTNMQTAGTDSATAFSTSLTTGLSTMGTGETPLMDMSAFTTNMQTAGTDSATAFSTSLSTGLSTVGTGETPLMDMSSFTTSMGTAGTDSATAFTTNLSTGLSTVGSGETPLMDMSSFTTSMGTAGTESAAAFSTSLSTGLSTAGTESMASLNSAVTAGATQATAAITTMGTDMTASTQSSFESMKSTATSAMEEIKNAVTSGAQAAANAIRSAFAGLQITIPRPQIPQVDVSYETVGGGAGATAKVPRFSVSYHKEGGIIDEPTLLGMIKGTAHVGGEAGPEAIVPLDSFYEKIAGIVTGDTPKVAAAAPAPEASGGTGGGVMQGGSFNPNINITVNGNMDSETQANLTNDLRETMLNLFREFRQEELENMELKNAYAL